MVSLFKSGDDTGVSTDATSDKEFLAEVAALLDRMVDRGMFLGDWELQLTAWLPQIVDIATALRAGGVRAGPGPVGRVLVCGSTNPRDVVGCFDSGRLDFPELRRGPTGIVPPSDDESHPGGMYVPRADQRPRLVPAEVDRG